MRRLEFHPKALCLLIGIGIFSFGIADTPDPTPRLLDVSTLKTIYDCDMTTTFPSTTETTELLSTTDDFEGTDTATPRLKDISQDASVEDCDETTTSSTSTTSVTSSSVTSTTTASGSSSSSSSTASSSSSGTTSTTVPGTTTSVIPSSTQKETSTTTSPMGSSTGSSSSPSSTNGRWSWFTRTTRPTEETKETEEAEETQETETTGADSTTTRTVSSSSTTQTTSGTSVSSSISTTSQTTESVSTTTENTLTTSVSTTTTATLTQPEKATSTAVTPSENSTAEVTNATSSFRTSTASPETSVPFTSSAGSMATSASTSVTSSEAKTTSTSTIEWTSTTPKRTSTATVVPEISTAALVDTTGISSTTTEVGTTSRKTTMETTTSSRTSDDAETKTNTDIKSTETTVTETTSRKTTPLTADVTSTETTMTRSTPEETTIGRTSTETETSATLGLTSVPAIPSATVTTTQPETTIRTDTTLKTSTTVTLSTLGTQGTSEETSPTPWTTSTVEWTTTSEDATTVKETTPRATTTGPRTSSDAAMTETTSQPITSTLKSTAVTMESVSSQILTSSLPGEILTTTGMERMTDGPATTEESLLGSSDLGRTETTEELTVGTTEVESTATDSSLAVETSLMTSDGTTEEEALSSTEMERTSSIRTSLSTWETTELLVSTTAQMETSGTAGSTDAETASTEDEKTSSVVASATDRTTAETETAETETPLQTSTSTIPTSSVFSPSVSTTTETVPTTVTNVPTTVTETEKGTRATEATTERIQSTRASTTDETKPSTSASSTVQRTTPARTTTENKDTESTRITTTAEEKTTSTERIRTTKTEEDVKTTEKMSTATTTSEQTEAPTTRTTEESTAARTQRLTTEAEEEATEDMRTAPVTTELKTEEATRARTTEEATTETQTGTSRLSTSVKSSLETMMDTETTESTTTTMTTTEATTTECPGECPEGWIVGGDRCYLHLEPGVHTIRVSVAKASCFHLGPFVGLAKQADMIRDRDVLWAAMAEKNLSTELFHVASENYLDQGGVLMGQAVNLSKLLTIPDYIPVDVSVEANAFCVQGKFCGKLNCDIQDVFDVQFRYLPKPPKNLVLPYGERADFPCLPPSPDSMSVTCGSRGFLVPKVSSLKCRYPVGFTPFAGNHRNNENRTSCAECWERGTDECVAVEGNKFQCVCREGWHGFTCRKTWNRCEQNKGYCLNGGSCVHHMDHVSCDCPEGFIGTRCTLGVRNITLFGSDVKLGLLGFSTAGTLIACAGIAALFMLMKAVKIWSSLQFLPLVLDRTCPQDTYIFMRNLMLLLAKFSMIVLGRPDFIFEFENHYVCKMADVWVYYLYSSAILFMFWEAVNTYEVLMELGTVEWGVDGNGDRRFFYGPKFRILTALVGPWLIVIPYTIVFWPEISWDHTCLGGMADVDFDSFSTLHWLLTGSFVWFIFCVWIYTLYMRKKWPEVYLQMEHQIETKRPLDTDKLERVQRNIHFPMLLSLSTWIFYMTSIGSYFHTGQELGTLYGWASIIASVIHSGLNICQFILIDDDALEEFMKIGVPRFPNLNWPRETPPRRFNHEELIAMQTGAPCEWKFHPSSTWYLSEPMRHSMHRKLASEYLKRRAAGKKIPECLETAHSWLANFVGEDPFSKQRTAVVEDFIVRVKEFDAEEIELEETEARAKGMQLLGIINATHLTETQKRRRRKIKKDMGKLAEVLNFRFFPLDVGCTLEVLEDGGDLPGDARHWERKKPEHLPARMRHQLPFFRKEMARLLETLKEDDPIREEYRRSEWSPGFEGTREDPNPFLLPGLAPYVELAYYDQLFNLKEAKDLADRAKSDHETCDTQPEIAKNKKIRKEVAARRRAEGVEDADTDDDWHVAPFDCPNGPPPGFKKPVVTSMETMMKKFEKEKKAAKKKQKKKEKKEKLQSIPRSSRK